MPRIGTEKCVIAFATTTQAMAMEACARRLGAEGRLIPLPPVIDAGCGLAWCAPAAARPVLEQMLREQQLGYAGIYELLL